MKILFCTPPTSIKTKTPTPPIGVGYIAGVLIENGHEVEIYDSYLYNATPKMLSNKIKQSNPDIVGVTCNAEDRLYALKIADYIKKEYNDKLVVMGGPLATFCDKDILRETKTDIVVRNEGEYSMLEIANGNSLETIKGITFKKENRIVTNQPREVIKDLNELPPIPYKLYDYKAYPNFLKEEKLYLDKKDCPKYSINVLFGRGCPYNCLFCSSKEFWGRRWRMISPERAVEQISELTNEGIKGFSIYDDHLLLNKEWFSKFVNLLKKEKLDIKYKCLGRVDSINKEVVNQLANSGCTSITLGIENGSQRVLDLMNKQIKVSDTKKVIKMLYEKKIRTKGGILLNTPGEMPSDIRISLKFIIKMRKLYKIQTGLPAPLKIYPGSDLERIAIQQGKLKDFSWTKPYFNKRNLLFISNPEVPLFENMDLVRLWMFLFKEYIKLKDYYLMAGHFKGIFDFLVSRKEG